MTLEEVRELINTEDCSNKLMDALWELYDYKLKESLQNTVIYRGKITEGIK